MDEMPLSPRRVGLNAFALKLFMAALMLMDHLYVFLPGFPVWFEAVSRLVAPCFCFLMTEGLVYTRSRKKYLLRLYTIGLIMLAMDFVFTAVFGTTPGNSIIMALAVSGSLICAIDQAIAAETPGEKTRFFLLAITLLAFSMVWEGFLVIPMMSLIFYYLRGRKRLMCAVFAAASLIFLAFFDFGKFQWLMIFSVIPIWFYNGQRGPSGLFAKWFFYVFYPAHIWILFILSQTFFR
ncbi:TraX family protein [Oscillospiraceae bacterium MB08-C2-2]|nr:TraX family protein [Oscillospiraceae bacterium MB08-C2-2]